MLPRSTLNVVKLLGIAVLIGAGFCSTLRGAEPFRVEMAVSAADGVFDGNLYFIDDKAIETSGATVGALFDLTDKAWTDASLGVEVTSARAMEWTQASVDRSKTSAAQMPDGDKKRLMLRLIDPQFKMGMDGNALIVGNEFIQYRIEPSDGLSKNQVAQLYVYDRLNAYRKAMVERKLPPFSQLAVTNEMEKRGIVPGRVVMRMQVAGGATEITTDYTYRPMSKEDKATVRGLIATGVE